MDKSKFKVARITLFLIIFYVLCSCSHTEKGYYKTGELCSECEKLDSLTSYCKFYYKNGKIKEEGYVKDSLPHGAWKEYFDDGDLKCESEFVNGVPIELSNDVEWPDFTKRNAFVKFEGYPKIPNKKEFIKIKTKVNDTLCYRNYVENTHETFYKVGFSQLSDSNKLVHLPEKKDSYPDGIVVKELPDTFCMVYDFYNEEGEIIVGRTPRTTFFIILEE